MTKEIILGSVLFFSAKNYAAINKNQKFTLDNRASITIAVIDTGTDTKHKDLRNSIWINEGETGIDVFGHDKATNGIDDDQNGFIDDVNGWNFVDNNNDVSDSHGHGTHISGIINKEFQKHQSSGTSSPSVRLMILKYFSSKADDAENILNTVKAIDYATKMKARIINYSGGGANQFPAEYRAIKKAGQNNIIFIAAAGNNNTNTDDSKYFPANYSLDNIISVAATDAAGELVSFSNFGSHSVDIAAPGKLVTSTLPGNSYGVMSGTSQATAFVTGAVAALLHNRFSLRAPEVLSTLISRAKFNKSLKGKTKFQVAMTQNLE